MHELKINKDKNNNNTHSLNKQSNDRMKEVQKKIELRNKSIT